MSRQASTQDEVIEVQILPQDSWADNGTAITGNTSDVSMSLEEPDGGRGRPTRRACWSTWMGPSTTGLVALLAFFSPIVMLLVPLTGLLPLKPAHRHCDAECDGALIALSFKLLVLAAGSCTLFLRRPRATLPRVFTLRALLTALLVVFTCSYWLFFVVRVLEQTERLQYAALVRFSASLVDTLLWIHYLAIVLLELRHVQPTFAVKVLRSPDGQMRIYTIGHLNIQRASAHILQHYYADFPVYNPYLERIPTARKASRQQSFSSYKYYDVDAASETHITSETGVRVLAGGKRRDGSHNERFYEECDYERRVRKRRARLITATEEAFTHIRRLREEHNQDDGVGISMDPQEAAQAIFPSMARALQKYLRVTRQQPRHTAESIVSHLSVCLQHGVSARAFLQQYLLDRPLLTTRSDRQRWSLVCATPLSRQLTAGLVFQLRQDDVSLLCTVLRLPSIDLHEQLVDPRSSRFQLRLNSETSV